MFMFGSDGQGGYRILGIIIIATALLTVFIRIAGSGSLFGAVEPKDEDEVVKARELSPTESI